MASVAEVPPGALVDVEVEDEVLVVANVEGTYYAVSGWCPHLGTSLALGTLRGSVLMCFAHLWRFDLRTGEPVWPAIARIAPGYRLRTYPVRVEGDDLLVSPNPGRPATAGG